MAYLKLYIGNDSNDLRYCGMLIDITIEDTNTNKTIKEYAIIKNGAIVATLSGAFDRITNSFYIGWGALSER